MSDWYDSYPYGGGHDEECRRDDNLSRRVSRLERDRAELMVQLQAILNCQRLRPQELSPLFLQARTLLARIGRTA